MASSRNTSCVVRQVRCGNIRLNEQQKARHTRMSPVLWRYNITHARDVDTNVLDREDGEALSVRGRPLILVRPPTLAGAVVRRAVAR